MVRRRARIGHADPGQTRACGCGAGFGPWVAGPWSAVRGPAPLPNFSRTRPTCAACWSARSRIPTRWFRGCSPRRRCPPGPVVGAGSSVRPHESLALRKHAVQYREGARFAASSATSTDNFERPNFDPMRGDRTLLAGFRLLLASRYAPENSYARCTGLSTSFLAVRSRRRDPSQPGPSERSSGSSGVSAFVARGGASSGDWWCVCSGGVARYRAPRPARAPFPTPRKLF